MPISGYPPLRTTVLAPLGVPLQTHFSSPSGGPLPSHPLCPKSSRGPPLRPAGPAPLGISSPQSRLSNPLPELPSLGSSPTPLRPGSPRPDSFCHLSAPRCSHLRPAVTTPGPASPPPLPLPHLFPSRSSAACSPVDPRVQSLSVGSGRAEPPPAVSALGPTLSRRSPQPPPPPPGATRTLPRPPLLLSEVRLLDRKSVV